MHSASIDNPGINAPENDFWNPEKSNAEICAELVRRARLWVGLVALAIVFAICGTGLTLWQRKAECALSAIVVYALGFFAAFQI